MELEQDLKEHGVDVVCSKMDSVISMRAHGATGKRLVETLRLMDKYVALKVTKLVKACADHIYCDPCFGPNDADPSGARALCKNGDVVPSKGGSQHQAKVLKLLKEDKLRWERPRYATATQNVLEESDESEYGNLGDCWFLGAISVLATRLDLLTQVFWRDDQYKGHGLFVCRFMKDFAWHYVIIDDRLPVFGYTNNRAGKPFFARCSDPNELWVPLMEKAYAKLHGSYEALIGGYIDVALSDLTGLCSEQIILKPGYPGFAEDPYKPIRADQKRGDEFWQKLVQYKRNGTLMGCSIQPDPKNDKNVVAEGSAGQGLYYKHAYGLVDVGEITLKDKSGLRLVKVRNPWGMGEWTGPWSDQSDEREVYDDEIQRVFKVIARSVGENAYSKLHREQHTQLSELVQEDVAEINQNDGTFFMTYADWSERYTHFFAGIDFADEWCGRRVQGKWDEISCGGNTSKATWINNPRFQLHVLERCHLFIAVSQNDPRGKVDARGLVPIGFHVCSVSEGPNGAIEIREPKKKAAPYYRLHPEASRQALLDGSVAEASPPPIIPGTVIPGVDDDGVPQPAYTLKQAASVDMHIEPGRYCIVPSLYMRTDKQSNKTNVGPFWISVYGNKPVFELEGGEPIIEEEEIDETACKSSPSTPAPPTVVLSPIVVPGDGARRQFENLKEEFLAQARLKGIGFREAKREFTNAGPMRRADFKRRMLNLGFKMDEVSDEKDRVVSIVPEKEDEEVPEKVNQEGTLTLRLVGGKDLQSVQVLQTTPPLLSFPALTFGPKDMALQEACMLEVLDEIPSLITELHPKFLLSLRPHDPIFQSRISSLLEHVKGPAKLRSASRRRGPKKKLVRHDTTPVLYFLAAVSAKFQAAVAKEEEDRRTAPPSTETKTRFSWMALETQTTLPVTTETPTDDLHLKLHTSSYMQSLEAKRAARFKRMQVKKAQVCGDKQKLASLPRLLGGRKTGTNVLHCVDCHAAVTLSGKGDGSMELTCSAQGCVHVFCTVCYGKLPACEKFCDDCYLHEHGNMEVLGMQLRSVLLSKLAASDAQLIALDEMFGTLDEDASGDLTVAEFTKFLDKLALHPPLTTAQIAALMEELDVDGNGTLSLDEFKRWMLGKEAAWAPEMVKDDDETWRRSPRAGRRTTLEAAERALLVPWIESVLVDLVADVLGAVANAPSPWIVTAHTTPTLERMAALPVIDGSTDECESIAKLFARFDINGDGSIATDELALLLSCVGLEATALDVRLLSHRLQREHGQIFLSDFATFVSAETSGTTRDRERALVETLLDLEQRMKEHRVVEGDVKMALQTLHVGMPVHELLWLSKTLLDRIGLQVDVLSLQRIALACTPCIYNPTLACAGDVLLALLQAPSGLGGTLLGFSVEVVSSAIQRLFKIASNDEELEWEKLGPAHVERREQGPLIEGLLRRGLRVLETPDLDSLAIENQVCVALALDALRYRDAQLPPLATHDVSRGLFLSLSRYTTLQRLEDKLRRTLQRMARVGSGQQMYQVTLAFSANKTLHVRVLDSMLKQAMTLSFADADMDTRGVPLFDRRPAPGSSQYWSMGVVNAEWYPELNAYFLALLRRLRICFRDDNGKKQPFVEFLESQSFVGTLRRLLQSTRVPFFWAVSPAMLEFSVDRATLDRAKMRLQPYTMLALQQFPALAAFFRQAHSTLRVHLEVLDHPTSMWLSWNEFKSCLAGLRNAYASIQLLPQGDTFVTPPDDGGGCTPQWSYATSVLVHEPDECVHRSDRPVVYVDTQPILGRPDSSGTNLIPFTSLSRTEAATLHFVVVSVRRTVPSTAEVPHLYCTAYDPATASDYEVVGTPTNWNVNFFDPDVNPDVEKQWVALLSKMKLGRTITPKLLIRLYNKQPRSDQLIGETEVSIASTMAREGYGVHSWFAIYDPVSELCTGQIELQVQFEMKTKGGDGRTMDATTNAAVTSTPKLKAIASAPTTASDDLQVTRFKQRIIELEAQLQAKPEPASTETASSNNLLKWKRKYEQLKHEAADQQAATEAKLAALQQQMTKLEARTPRSEEVAPGDASASAAFAALKATLSRRCPDRPFNGLKKAMLAVAETPGKVGVPALDEVLDDFGLRLDTAQRQNVLALLDPDRSGIVSIPEFFARLGGDAALSRAASRASLEPSPRASISKKPSTPRIEQPPSPEVPDDVVESPAKQRRPTTPVETPHEPEEKVTKHRAEKSEQPAPVKPERPHAVKPLATPSAEPPKRPAKLKSVKPEATPVAVRDARDEQPSNNPAFEPTSDEEMFAYLQAHLPDKWDMQFTNGGKPYFRNFTARSTQWNHPDADADAIFRAYQHAKKKKSKSCNL
ncbi:hypothetical protein SPRG_22065 [Saprolegnia parasitica CBS 223.65]|uniref:Uncharacterized protein n=1 Tax=Saprolegnia parasitica (strain CBS 223.65) TaxID=695850 RepID=A0A067CWM0_SAPPC|nr:hypothetical protein SPRG_22065 [Saprolegnia parasitica CBS 223.65]KDO35099.1 hypothetical protein SPRG_22065 [Saprolegnia parasitica CBS 223.65]|eukprot:XP_012194836.1 hypothetical protein SPRG_22065 [Saprolegnia parasitica CBS 223.65]